MVRNKLAAAILGVSLALPGVASALGVGDYTLKSYLSQPLKLEIGLIQTKDLGTDEVSVGLATPQEHERLGVEYVHSLQDLQFEVVQGADGGMNILVTSRKAVNEPYLNFLMQVQWPGGRALREYTILLDIYKAGDAPTATEQPLVQMSESAPAAESVATVTTTADQLPPLVMSDGSTFDESTLPPAPVVATTEPVAEAAVAEESGLPPPPTAALEAKDTRVAQPAPEPAPSRPAAREGEYQVVANDTMWEIARRHQGTGTVQQTMLAIQRANPDAFVKGNLNLVKKGAVLRIPGEDEVQQISRNEASTEFAAQTRAWRELLDQRAVALPSDKAMLEASKPVVAKPAAPKGTGKGEVTLVSPQASGKSGKATSGKSAEALQNELAIAQEGISKAARENKELEKRLGDLDKKISASEKQLTVKNDRIASLQEELSRLQKAQGVEVAAPAEAPATAETAEPAVAATEEQAKPKKEKKAQPPAEAVAEPAAPALPLLPIIAGAVVLLGGAAFFFLRRRKAASATDDSAEHDEEIAEDLAQLQDFNLGDESEDDVQDALADGGDAGASAGDPLGEADMYVAYGRFQQAADILYAALQREPEREDIRVKLAEVYAEMGDNDAAAEYARAVAGSSDDGVRQQAEAVLARVGGGAPAATIKAAAVQAPVLDDTLSLDDLAQEFSAPSDTGANKALDDLSLDLDDAPATAAAPAVAEELDFSLDDVDLDLGGTAEIEEAPALAGNTEVRPKADFGEIALEEASFDDLALPEADDVPVAAAAEEFSLEDEFALEETAALPALEDDLDFAATSGTQPKLTDEMVAAAEEISLDVVPEPVAAAEVDLEAELADLETDLQASDSTGGDDFDFLADSDENATKLDLAKAYIDMGDADGARDILNEVLAEGNATQKAEAQKLIAQVG